MTIKTVQVLVLVGTTTQNRPLRFENNLR